VATSDTPLAAFNCGTIVYLFNAHNRPGSTGWAESGSTVYQNTCPSAVASAASRGTTPPGRSVLPRTSSSFSRTRWRAK
jgi:hypothetical protein